jgi:hypothetical protein
VLRGAALIAKTPQETTEVEQRLAEAETYASTQVANKTETQHAETAAVPGIEKLSHRFIPRGPHLFLVGMIKGVHCSPPALDLMVKSRAKNVALHSENYYKIQITALFAVADDLNPCDDLENRIAKVEYVESMNASDAPRLIAIELHN